MKKKYENYLANYIAELETENSSKYLELYSTVGNEYLRRILSNFHFELNSILTYLNDRIESRYFHAHESRVFIDLINSIKDLKETLNKSKFSFSIAPLYDDILLRCRAFLNQYNGSEIPEDFVRVKIEELLPIFIQKSFIQSKNNFHYKLNIIGEGSYAKVFKFRDEFNQIIVLKRAKDNLTEIEVERFFNEFNEMKKLNSPYITKVFRIDKTKNEYFMEYADFTLKKYIDSNCNKLSNNTRISLVLQILNAFKYLHSKKILHRDISITNILVKEYDDVCVIKLADFGLLKKPDNNLTNTNTKIKGCFNDPELSIIGFKNYSIKHEVYALTRIIYFVLYGKTTINHYNTEEFKSFINKGVSKNLINRFNSITEMIEEFNGVKDKIFV